jgi:hypothetical protein
VNTRVKGEFLLKRITMPHKEPKGDGAYEFYKGYPYELRKALKEQFPKGVICPICTNDGKDGCERYSKGQDPKSGLCPKFDPPRAITFARVLEATNASRTTVIRSILSGKKAK